MGKTVFKSVMVPYCFSLSPQGPAPASLAGPGSSTHVTLDTLLMHNLVDLVGGDAGSECGGGNVENLSCQTADLAHGILGLVVQKFDLVPVHEGSRAELGDAIGGVVWPGDRLWDFTLCGEGIYGAQGAGVGEAREGVEVAGLWIRFRYYLWREEAMNNTVFCLVHGLVGAL